MVLVNKVPMVELASGIAKDADVVVVGLACASGKDVLVGLPDDLGRTLGRTFGADVASVAAGLGASSKPGTTVALPAPGGRRVLVAGLGDIDVTAEQVRRAAGGALRVAAALPGTQPLTVAVSFDTVGPQVIQGVTEGAILGAYTYRPNAANAGVGVVQIVTSARRTEARPAMDAGVATATAVCQARDWVNEAPNTLYPESFAAAIKEYGRAHRLTVDIMDEKALAAEGFGGLLAVGGGSVRGPRLVKVTYAPRGATKHLALVGKGITFDSGGLDLKQRAGMYIMKFDMSGAAAVVAAIAAIADLGIKVRVSAYGCLAENLPSGTAYRPSDVLTMYNKLTVENSNTDAEGRLVLADGLALASEEKPDLIVDVATLTSACTIALGERVAGLMSRDDATVDRILDAAETAGELFWQLPIPEETRAKLDSKVADLKSSSNPEGGALTAAGFLSEFVPRDLAWAHVDIAGPAFNEYEPYDYVPAGATGVAVRTLVALARSLAG